MCHGKKERRRRIIIIIIIINDRDIKLEIVIDHH
jgi:hypothetical protein